MAGLGGGQRQAGAKGAPLDSSRACLQRAAQKGAAPSAWAASPAVPSKGAYKERFSLSRAFRSRWGGLPYPPSDVSCGKFRGTQLLRSSRIN